MSDDAYAIEWLRDFRVRWFASITPIGYTWLCQAELHLSARLDKQMRGKL